MDGSPHLSVIVVTRHRHDELVHCLASLARQDGAPPFEVLVVADDDPAVVEVVAAVLPTASVAVVPKSHPGAARNVAVARARGELLVFLDDDVQCDPSLLRNIVTEAEAHPEADVFGGPNLTPAGRTRFEVVQGEVLASMVASGPMRWRYRSGGAGPADERTLTLCNLVVRRAAMVPFTAQLSGGEENRVMQQLVRGGATMRYSPALGVDHERRPDVRTFTRQMWKYGRGRGQLIALNPRGVHAAYVLPSLLVLLLLATPAGTLVLGPWALAPAALWTTTVVAGGAVIARRSGSLSAWPLAVALIVLEHLGYGCGVLRGALLPRRGHQPVAAWEPVADSRAG